jgi:hypothetical protein
MNLGYQVRITDRDWFQSQSLFLFSHWPPLLCRFESFLVVWYDYAMEDKIQALREFIQVKAASKEFVHHKWFAHWHLELVEKISLQLHAHYPDADQDIIRVMAWLHDYGKIIDFDNQHDHKYVDEGKNILLNLGFNEHFAQEVADNIKRHDSKLNIDQANIETQIVSSSDGCSHLVGPFISLYWWENPGKSLEAIMEENARKLRVDWDKKVTLPEARSAYKALHDSEFNKSQGVIPVL